MDSDPQSDRTWLLETERGSGQKTTRKAWARESPRYGPSMRLELRELLAFIALVGLLFAAIRSFLVADLIGLLAWPAMLGFGIDRLSGGHGTWSGTVAGSLGLAGFATEPSSFVLFAGIGAIWGFYLGVWFYIIVETLIYYLC